MRLVGNHCRNCGHMMHKCRCNPLSNKEVLAPLRPWTEEEFIEFANQEPLPPNQSFQLPAEEQPITESEEYAEH